MGQSSSPLEEIQGTISSELEIPLSHFLTDVEEQFENLMQANDAGIPISAGELGASIESGLGFLTDQMDNLAAKYGNGYSSKLDLTLLTSQRLLSDLSTLIRKVYVKLVSSISEKVQERFDVAMQRVPANADVRKNLKSVAKLHVNEFTDGAQELKNELLEVFVSVSKDLLVPGNALKTCNNAFESSLRYDYEKTYLEQALHKACLHRVDVSYTQILIHINVDTIYTSVVAYT